MFGMLIFQDAFRSSGDAEANKNRNLDHIQNHAECDRRGKRARDRRPKLGQRIAKWMSRSIRHCLGTVFFKTGTRVIAREAFWGDALSRLFGLPG
jgi:hypothetical protein